MIAKGETYLRDLKQQSDLLGVELKQTATLALETEVIYFGFCSPCELTDETTRGTAETGSWPRGAEAGGTNAGAAQCPDV